MLSLKLKIVCTNPDLLPNYQTAGSAGMDLHADIKEPITLKPLQRLLVPTGIYVELPEGLEVQIRPRSGLALKHGVTIPNSPATVDSDYRGQYQVILQNLGDKDFIINPGERIAQMVVARYEKVDWQVVDELADTERGASGFGSTGR